MQAQTLQNIRRKTTSNLLGINLEETRYKLVISLDDSYNESPLYWQDNVVLVCKHPRYNLGHDNGLDLLQDAIINHRRYGTKVCDKFEDEEGIHFGSLQDLLKVIERFDMTDTINIMPLSLYDHSGLSMRVGNYSGWDCGQVGIAFQTIDTMNTKRKTFSKELIEESNRYIKSVVKTYDQYLRGGVYVYKLVKVTNDEEEVLDSLGGIYGYDDDIIEEFIYNMLDVEALQAHKAGKLEIKYNW